MDQNLSSFESDRNKKKRFAVFKDLGILEYKKALELQIQTVKAIQTKTIKEDHIFFVEHPSVFTLGKRGGLENLSVTKQFLNSKNIDIIKTDRGGNITWHGPGQAVLYPVINLEKNRIGIKDFVHGLEEIMKLTANHFNINADRNKKNHGIWVGNSKIGSVGISVKKGISMHGLALNINPDLTPFSWINPCGLSDISITSIEKEVEKNITCQESGFPGSQSIQDDCLSSKIMDAIKKKFLKYFARVFDFEIYEI